MQHKQSWVLPRIFTLLHWTKIAELPSCHQKVVRRNFHFAVKVAIYFVCPKVKLQPIFCTDNVRGSWRFPSRIVSTEKEQRTENSSVLHQNFRFRGTHKGQIEKDWSKLMQQRPTWIKLQKRIQHRLSVPRKCLHLWNIFFRLKFIVSKPRVKLCFYVWTISGISSCCTCSFSCSKLPISVTFEIVNVINPLIIKH